MGVGRSAKRVGSATGGMNLLAAVAVGTVVAAILDRQAAGEAQPQAAGVERQA